MISRAETKVGHGSRQNLSTELRQLAELWGMEVAYQDVTGQRQEASPEALMSVLPILGAPVTSLEDVRDALRQKRQADWQRVLEPVYVAWDASSADIVVRLAKHQANAAYEWTLEPENGPALSNSGHFKEVPDEQTRVVERARYVQKRITIPGPLPHGYHRLSLEVAGTRHESLVIAAPTRAYVPLGCGWQRSWGLFIPLHALHSQQSWGAGDFGDLRAFREWAHDLGASFVGTLPLLAAFLDEPFEPSPYSPVSRLFWNEFYLNLSDIPEVQRSPAATRLLESSEWQQQVNQLRAAPLVDYRAQMQLKRQVLEEALRDFFAEPSPRREAFAEYVAAHPRLEDYAAFRAVGERLRTSWQQWPLELRNGVVRDEDYDQQHKRYHMYVQWIADEQLQTAAERSRGGLYLDLPLGVNASGYDVWRHREVFAVGVAGGCPPDIVFPKGQNWGFVPLHPEGIRAQGYQYVRAYLRHQLRLAQVLRIDHMPSFHRVFWIAPGQEASHGVYVRYRSEELYAVFCVESHRHQTMLVGEDLGTVPPEVPQAMTRHNFHRMYVMQYEIKPDPSAALPPPSGYSVASINTHDMPPLAGFWQGSDLAERADAGLLPIENRAAEEEGREQMRQALRAFLFPHASQPTGAEERDLLQACLDFLRDSPARMVLVNLEDLWQETQSQNIPSTAGDNPNWRRKAAHSLEQLQAHPQVLAALKALAAGF